MTARGRYFRFPIHLYSETLCNVFYRYAFFFH